MLILTRKDIDKIYTMQDCIDSVTEAFALSSSKQVKSPVRSKLTVEHVQGNALFMPGLVEEKGYLGAKIVSVFPQNSAKGKAVVNATIVMLEVETGEVKALIDGTYVTKMRTGAATGASIKLLARENVKIGVLFGTGGQAEKQLEAMIATRIFDEIRFEGRNFEKTINFFEKMNEIIPYMKVSEENKNVNITAYKDGNDAVPEADVIVLATTSDKGLFDGNLLKSGVHISGVGSYTKQMCEMDKTTVLTADKVYIDDRDAMLEEAGDFTQLIDEGILSDDFYTGEIGDLILGKVPGRETEDEITIFKSVGISAQDLVAAESIYKKAVELGVGLVVDFD